MRAKYLVRVLILIIFTGLSSCKTEFLKNKAKVYEEVQTIPTYPFSDPNPVPLMAHNSDLFSYYPYLVWDGYTVNKSEKKYQVVTLENEYIKVLILPELGGKIYGAIEKKTGKEFVYLNHVLKFRSIGVRGPWTSGGIEHNFGLDIKHAPWTSSPVDYTMKEEKDGSVSCTVGTFDPASGTQWRVKIKLDSDKSYFTTKSFWYNPTLISGAYVSWENAAFKAGDDLQFYFDGNSYLGHDGSVSDWPYDKEGRNLSLYRNNNFGTDKSYHVFGSMSDWFGGYWNDSDFGFGHWSSKTDAPGKKIWIWSLSRQGAIWDKLLSDTDGMYIEAQSGVKFNQGNRDSGFNSPFKQLSLHPAYTETKTDYWFPVMDIKGVVDASPYGSMNIIPENDSISILFSPNVNIKDTLKVFAGDELLEKRALELFPTQVEIIKLEYPQQEQGVMPLRVDFGNGKLKYNSEFEQNLSERPAKTPPIDDFQSAEHLYRKGMDLYAMREFNNALELFNECLKKETTHTGAMVMLAEIYYRRANYALAKKYALLALSFNTYDGKANFILGNIYQMTGDPNRAFEAYSTACRTMEYRSAALTEISGIKIGTNHFDEAIHYATEALDYNRKNLKAYEYLAAAYRQSGQVNKAKTVIQQVLEIDPLNHFAKFERYLLNPNQDNLLAFQKEIRNEFPVQSYLEIATEYDNLKLTGDANKVLKQAPANPMVFYLLAYHMRIDNPDESLTLIKKAGEMSPEFVFPFRLESIPVLRWAVSKSQSWKTKYYLALNYWSKLNTEEASQLFLDCANDPDYGVFYISRAMFFEQNSGNRAKIKEDYYRALRLAPQEWRTWNFLSKFLISDNKLDSAEIISEQAFQKFPQNDIIGIQYAKTLLNTRKYESCLEVLDNILVLPAEAASEGHDLFYMANIGLALQKIKNKKYHKALIILSESNLWPENLGVGEPYNPDNRLQDYLAAYCERKLGKKNEADTYLKNIREFSSIEQNWNETNHQINNYLGIKILNRSGLNHEASTMYHSWIAHQDSIKNWGMSIGSGSAEIQWVLAKQKGDTKMMSEIENLKNDVNQLSFLDLFVDAMNITNNVEN